MQQWFCAVLAAALFAPVAVIGQDADTSTTWGAISVSVDGLWGSAVNQPSSKSAVELAEAGCRGISKVPDACTTAAAFDEGWVVGILCTKAIATGKYSYRAVAANGVDRKNAIAVALGMATGDKKFTSGDCYLIAAVAAKGNVAPLPGTDI